MGERNKQALFFYCVFAKKKKKKSTDCSGFKHLVYLS